MTEHDRHKALGKRSHAHKYIQGIVEEANLKIREDHALVDVLGPPTGRRRDAEVDRTAQLCTNRSTKAYDPRLAQICSASPPTLLPSARLNKWRATSWTCPARRRCRPSISNSLNELSAMSVNARSHGGHNGSGRTWKDP